MPIGANVGSGQYLIRANAKISLSWKASPIFLVVNRLTLQTCVIKHPSAFT